MTGESRRAAIASLSGRVVENLQGLPEAYLRSATMQKSNQYKQNALQKDALIANREKKKAEIRAIQKVYAELDEQEQNLIVAKNTEIPEAQRRIEELQKEMNASITALQDEFNKRQEDPEKVPNEEEEEAETQQEKPDVDQIMNQVGDAIAMHLGGDEAQEEVDAEAADIVEEKAAAGDDAPGSASVSEADHNVDHEIIVTVDYGDAGEHEDGSSEEEEEEEEEEESGSDTNAESNVTSKAGSEVNSAVNSAAVSEDEDSALDEEGSASDSKSSYTDKSGDDQQTETQKTFFKQTVLATRMQLEAQTKGKRGARKLNTSLTPDGMYEEAMQNHIPFYYFTKFIEMRLQSDSVPTLEQVMDALSRSNSPRKRKSTSKKKKRSSSASRGKRKPSSKARSKSGSRTKSKKGVVVRVKVAGKKKKKRRSSSKTRDGSSKVRRSSKTRPGSKKRRSSTSKKKTKTKSKTKQDDSESDRGRREEVDVQVEASEPKRRLMWGDNAIEGRDEVKKHFEFSDDEIDDDDFEEEDSDDEASNAEKPAAADMERKHVTEHELQSTARRHSGGGREGANAIEDVTHEETGRRASQVEREWAQAPVEKPSEPVAKDSAIAEPKPKPASTSPKHSVSSTALVSSPRSKKSTSRSGQARTERASTEVKMEHSNVFDAAHSLLTHVNGMPAYLRRAKQLSKILDNTVTSLEKFRKYEATSQDMIDQFYRKPKPDEDTRVLQAIISGDAKMLKNAIAYRHRVANARPEAQNVAILRLMEKPIFGARKLLQRLIHEQVEPQSSCCFGGSGVRIAASDVKKLGTYQNDIKEYLSDIVKLYEKYKQDNWGDIIALYHTLREAHGGSLTSPTNSMSNVAQMAKK